VSKWALWAAHRYVQPGAAVPRRTGADGRALSRPWRHVSPRARERVAALRSARAQPVWPRLVGWACLGMASVIAVAPVGPVPTHVARSASARPGSQLASPVAVSPAAVAELTAATRFRWRAGAASPPFAVVVFDERLDPLLRRDGIAATEWTPDPDALRALQGAATFHWQVLGDGCGRVLASSLQTVERAPARTVGAIVR
jgi:hypothetical protein